MSSKTDDRSNGGESSPSAERENAPAEGTHSGGGAMFKKSVSVQGGNLAGRDLHLHYYSSPDTIAERSAEGPVDASVPDRDASDEPTLPGLLPESLTAYIEWVRERYGQVDMIGLGAGELRMPLDDIYVPLRLDVSHRGLGRAWPRGEVGESMNDRELHAEWGTVGQRSIELHEAFRVAGQKRNVFILGRPGAGKTTALKKLLWAIVKPEGERSGLLHGDAVGLPGRTIPIFLRLRNLTGPLLRHPMAEYLQRELESTARGALSEEVLAGLGKALWQRGGLLLLLDGLDEVADAELRKKICGHLEQVLDRARERGIHAVVSSRFSGVSSDIDLDQARFTRLEVHSLDDQQIEQLVTSWFQAAEQALDRDGDPEKARQRGETTARELARRLRQSEYKARRIRELSTNPMLLTLLCVVVMRNFEIPRRRVDFFEKCLEVLLGQWTKHRSQTAFDRLDETRSSDTGVDTPSLLWSADAKELLMPVAWAMHKDQRKYDLRRDELRRLLRPVLSKLERERGDLPFGQVLRWLHQTTGVLMRYGVYEDSTGEYGFMHLSLQEYLAARHAAEERELDVLASRFGDEWWREVILLFAAFSDNKKNFTELLQRVIDRGALSDDEQINLIGHCIEDAHNPDLTPLIDHALDSGRPEPSRVAALGLLMGHVDDDVLYAAARVACESGPGTLRERAERIEAQPIQPRKSLDGSEPAGEPPAFDVFLCHDDDAGAEAIAAELRGAGLTLWQDGERLEFGSSWRERLSETIDNVGAIVVLLDAQHGARRPESVGQKVWHTLASLFGQRRLAPWQRPEMRVRLSQMRRRGRPVLLVRMPGTRAISELPYFLRDARVVDLPDGISSSGMEQLVRGIQGGTLDTPAGLQERHMGQRVVEESVGMALVWLPGGAFMMGSRDDDPTVRDNEKPAREVRVSGLWMGETAVTNGQYEHYVRAGGKEPRFWTSTSYNQAEQPVVGVSWYEAVRYCNYLSDRAGLERCYEGEGEEVEWNRKAEGYRLPTEAEWEYACRAGTHTRWSFGDDERELGAYAWYEENSGGGLQPVARKKANGWGLYDMHGNVWEWCWDWYKSSYKGLGRKDPMGPRRNELAANDLAAGQPVRILRGGSFDYRAGALRSASRDRYGPGDWDQFIGFRCVRGAVRQP